MNDQDKTREVLIKELQELRDENEKFNQSNVTSISERARTEDALQSSEQGYRLLFENSLDAFLLTDPTGSIINVNPATCKMFGRTAEDICRIGRSGIMDTSDPRLKTAMEERTRTGRFSGELTCLRKDGTRFPVEISSTVFTDDNGQSRTSMIIRDITERKEREKLLRESEVNARAIMESTDDVLLLLDKTGIVIDCNEAHAKRFNTTRNELLGKNIFDRLPKDIAEGRRKIINEAISTGKPACSEDFHGGYWNEFVMHPIYVENEITDKVAIFARDITERKQAEELIRESEERFRGLLQSVSSVSVQGYSPDGTTQYWNKASENLYGYTEQEAIGRNLLDLIIPSEMKEIVKQAILQMAETGTPIPSSELSLMRKDGSRVSVFSSHAIVKSSGKSQELFCIDIDLTEHKQAEEVILKSKQQFDNLVAQIPVGVYILRTKPDYTFNLEYVSPVMAEILGLSIESLLANTGIIFKAIHPEDMEEVARLNLEGIIQKQPFDWKGRAVVQGVVKWLHMSSLPQQQENGDILWHGLIVDITEQMRDEEEIRKQNEKLQELNATKDKFFSIIAHDLRSPFNSFLGLTQIMAEELPSLTMSQVQEIAVSMSKSATNLYRLLENLLHWARMQQGTISFNPRYVLLEPIIAESIDLIQQSAKNKSIEIVADCSQGLKVIADTDLLQTIFRNLVSNAVKFTSKGGKVRLSAKVNADNNIQISIHDTGIGMSSEMLAGLFQINIKTNRKGTDGEPSAGLGLLLCKEFVEMHGGQIWAESDEGMGSAFYFTLPQ